MVLDAEGYVRKEGTLTLRGTYVNLYPVARQISSITALTRFLSFPGPSCTKKQPLKSMLSSESNLARRAAMRSGVSLNSPGLCSHAQRRWRGTRMVCAHTSFVQHRSSRGTPFHERTP